MVGIGISWDCDLDWKLERCDPEYTFRRLQFSLTHTQHTTHTHTLTHRLDDPHVKLSAGYNFRFARYHLKDGVQTRTLYKAYGILFRVVTTGRVWLL